MDEILKQLFASDVLSEETKAKLQEQFKAAVEAYLSEERAKLEQDVNARLTEEFVKSRDTLVEQVNAKVDEFLKAEMEELHEDIDKFRDLEVEHAERLVEERATLAQRMNEELETLTDTIDKYLDKTIKDEFEELREDIDHVKQLQFGREIFEAMEKTFMKHRQVNQSKLERELAEAKESLTDARKRLQEQERARLEEARNSKLDELLSPLTGVAREQMKLILSNVATEKLDEAYKVYLSRVLKESVSKPAAEPLVEAKKEAAAPAAEFVTGNEEEQLTEATAAQTPTTDLQRWLKVAGLA